MARLNIPTYAKQSASRGLKLRKSLPKSKQFGLSKQSASRMGVFSGVARAEQLIRSKSISLSDAKRVASFYNRFKNRSTPKIEGAILLWGGRRFGKLALNHVLKYHRNNFH